MSREARARPFNPDTVIKKQERMAKRYSQDDGTFYKNLQAKLNPYQTYWYIFGYTDLGRPVFLGP